MLTAILVIVYFLGLAFFLGLEVSILETLDSLWEVMLLSTCVGIAVVLWPASLVLSIALVVIGLPLLGMFKLGYTLSEKI